MGGCRCGIVLVFWRLVKWEYRGRSVMLGLCCMPLVGASGWFLHSILCCLFTVCDFWTCVSLYSTCYVNTWLHNSDMLLSVHHQKTTKSSSLCAILWSVVFEKQYNIYYYSFSCGLHLCCEHSSHYPFLVWLGRVTLAMFGIKITERKWCNLTLDL